MGAYQMKSRFEAVQLTEEHFQQSFNSQIPFPLGFRLARSHFDPNGRCTSGHVFHPNSRGDCRAALGDFVIRDLVTGAVSSECEADFHAKYELCNPTDLTRPEPRMGETKVSV